MIKVVKIYLPKSLYESIESVNETKKILYDNNIKNIIEEEYSHIVDICRYGYRYTYSYCKISKSISINISTNDSRVFFMDY